MKKLVANIMHYIFIELAYKWKNIYYIRCCCKSFIITGECGIVPHILFYTNVLIGGYTEEQNS